jgi:ammonium transporter, Amt family
MHKVRPARFLIFISIWSVVVYDPVARWSWDPDGWSNKLGVMDFAGGTPVHIVSGTTVAAFSVFCSIERNSDPESLIKNTKILVEQLLGNIHGLLLDIWRSLVALAKVFAFCCLRRRYTDRNLHSEDEEGGQLEGGAEDEMKKPFEPYNINYLVLGTALLWFGWAGFNGGSALGGNLRAVSAWTSTHIAACTGGTVGVLYIWFLKIYASLDVKGRPDETFDDLTVIYFCDGAIAGLVAITPASGYVAISSPNIYEDN